MPVRSFVDEILTRYDSSSNEFFLVLLQNDQSVIGLQQCKNSACRHVTHWCQVYKLLMETSSSVQPISCDEAFMDITGLGDPDRVVRQLRDKIVAATGINASAGIGPNMLLARLATKRAKPNGQFNINPSQVRWSRMLHPRML